LQRTATLGGEIGNPLIGLDGEADVNIDLLLESVIEGVLVNGEVDYTLRGQCSRCLEPLSQDHRAEFSQLYLWEPSPDAEGEELPSVHNDLIDLTDELRDAVGLDMPLAPVCTADCRGLCAQCGINLNDAPDHEHPTTDPRWAALADLDLPEEE